MDSAYLLFWFVQVFPSVCKRILTQMVTFSRMGRLFDHCARLCSGRKQAYAYAGLRMHRHQWQEWLRKDKFELDTRQAGQRLRELDGSENSRQGREDNR